MNSIVRDAIICSWECALAGTPVTYLSGPITTGPRLFDALRAGGTTDRRVIINLNSQDLRKAAAQLRAGGGGVVVEPASLTVPGWTQADYIGLWDEFIGRFAKEVRFMPGWEFSAGCAAEFARATELGRATLSLSGDAITAQLGRSRLIAALAEIQSLGGVQLLAGWTATITDAVCRLSRLAPAAA
jgi:hypothetical protein